MRRKERETGQEEVTSEKPRGLEQREEEREFEAQGGTMTMQEECVEGKEEETNSMHEEDDVSNRHMT